MLHNAIPDFKEEGVFCLNLEDDFFSRQEEYRLLLKTYVEEVFSSRYSMPVKVTFASHESDAPDFRIQVETISMCRW